MNKPDDHIQISEQLRDLLEGNLEPERAETVRTHLTSCDSCTAELRAIESLAGLPEEPLSEIEASRLHGGVLQALNSVAAAAASPAPAGKAVPIRYRFAQALGAAALLAVIGGISYFALFQSEEDQVAGGAADSVPEAGEQMAEIGFELKFRQPQPVPLNQGKSQPDDANRGNLEVADTGKGVGTSGGAAGTGGEAEDAPQEYDAITTSPRPLYVRGAGAISDRTLTLVGRFGLPLVLFPEAYTPSQAMDLQTSFLQQLANAAETQARSEQVLRCGSSVLARPHPVLPALATFGRLKDETTLVMAFAWTDSPEGRLDRFMVWTWRGGDCDTIPSYRSGYINR